MEKIDFLKKGITDFFSNFFITFSKVQRNIFNEKSHSNRKTNLKVDLVSCVIYVVKYDMLNKLHYFLGL